MGIQITKQHESQTARLKIKTLSQQMKQNAINGVGMSLWEADVLVDQIESVYFTDESLRGIQPGQLQCKRQLSMKPCEKRSKKLFFPVLRKQLLKFVLREVGYSPENIL